MPEDPDLTELQSVFEAKVAEELRQADRIAPGSDVVRFRGSVLATVLCVKGLPGPAEVSGGAAVSGADGEAALKGLAALGYEEDDVAFVLSRPDPSLAHDRLIARLARVIEAVDPTVVLALDQTAATDVFEAVDVAAAKPGVAVRASGRRVVALDGLEASLGDEGAKKRIWRQMKSAAPEGPIF